MLAQAILSFILQKSDKFSNVDNGSRSSDAVHSNPFNEICKNIAKCTILATIAKCKKNEVSNSYFILQKLCFK